jgi:hypothetical protein
MIITILIALAVIIIALIVIVAMRPSDFRVTRTATISAPAEVVFTQVNDLHKWEAWSPWAKLDPAAKITYEGPPAGAGASFRWAGNNKVGEGSMIIMESRPWRFCVYRRRIKVGPDRRRNPAWSSLIDTVMQDMDKNPSGGDLFERLERILGCSFSEMDKLTPRYS